MAIYVVVSGDTIYSIAERFAVSAERIINENQLESPDKLVAGQTLVITGSPLFPPMMKIGGISLNGYAYPYIKKQVLEQALLHLTYVSPFTYGFTPEGELVDIADSEILAMAEEQQVAPLMVIAPLSAAGSFSNLLSSIALNNMEVQNRLLDNIEEKMKQKNYYGLDIDFEYVGAGDRDAYTEFIANAASRLHPGGHPVSVALAPKTTADQPGLLYEGHDYYGIGRVADYVLLMTYEWGYTYGPPMAVAPINKVREVLDYAVTEIPSGKIYMGIPNYGYDWTLPYVRGESKARSIGNVEAVDIAGRYGAEIKFDETAMSPFFNYLDEEGREHVVWFEDARSVEAKLDLVAAYGLWGVGYWNLMRPFPQNWLLTESLFQIRKAF